MMDFTRKQEPVVTRLDLAELTQDMVDFCESMAERNNVRLALEVDKELPPVKGDRIQLEQVLLNLIVNAIEASASSDDDLVASVNISVQQDQNRQLRVQVKDQGLGISESDMSRLFDRFFQPSKLDWEWGWPSVAHW